MLDLSDAMSSGVRGICAVPVVGAIVKSPVYSALLVSALIAAILLAMYRGAYAKGGAKKGVRAFVYILLASLAVMSLHYYACRDCFMWRREEDLGYSGGGPLFSSVLDVKPGDERPPAQPEPAQDAPFITYDELTEYNPGAEEQ